MLSNVRTATRCLVAAVCVSTFLGNALFAADQDSSDSAVNSPGGGASNQTYDLVVYGGTSAGVIAAVQARKMGENGIIVCPEQHLGGLSSGGLGWTDSGRKGRDWRSVTRVLSPHLGTLSATENWKWQKSEAYGNRGQGTEAIDSQQRTMWIFEHTPRKPSLNAS